MNENIIVECAKVKFYSPYDEDVFFEWLQKIKSIKGVQGKADSILLIFENKINISEDDLYNLVSLFKRYKISMKELEPIVNDANREQFESFQYGYSINVYLYSSSS